MIERTTFGTVTVDGKTYEYDVVREAEAYFAKKGCKVRLQPDGRILGSPLRRA